MNTHICHSQHNTCTVHLVVYFKGLVASFHAFFKTYDIVEPLEKEKGD